MVRKIALTMAAIGAALPALAIAQTGTSYQLVARGHFDAAIDRLEERRRDQISTPEATLNLATAYAQTGNRAKAIALYAEVLAQPSVDLDLVTGDTASSHQIAQRGLTLLGRTLATR
ncbi:MAG: tetratricopeptide repeat protein [Sphingomonas bacterium]|nr:tetratricopeptide repeat protein [Sphingomonas bacterium]